MSYDVQMHYDLSYMTPDDAFATLVQEFRDETANGGDQEHIGMSPSRVGDVAMMNHPALIVLGGNDPVQRVLFNPARDANPFFHLYEAMWMLAGSEDIRSLELFSSKIASFCSDDGKTANGAYGARWRYARNPEIPAGPGKAIDQLELLIQHLTKNPKSRRAVLQMWMPDKDLLKIDVTKDVCCLASETLFRSPEGDTRIDELAKKFQTTTGFKFPIYSVDTTTGNQNISWMTNAWKVGVKPVYRFNFDDGSSVKMTSNHVVFRKKKMFEGQRCIGVSIEEVQASDLKVGDRLLATLSEDATSRVSSGKPGGYRVFKKNVFKKTSGKNMKKEHIEYMSLFQVILPGHSIHHINGDKLDNRLENLVQLKNSDHFALNMVGSQNPHNRMTMEEKAARGKKHSVSLKAHWDGMDEETRKAYACPKSRRTNKQHELVEEYRSKRSNHKIVSIEKVGVEPVYDFTVPGRHNAVLANGVVVHNCNTAVYFTIREEQYLDMTVTNRSNDLVLGLMGANLVHFTILQEYMARSLGIKVGLWYQFTNNLHVYLTANGGFHPDKWIEGANRLSTAAQATYSAAYEIGTMGIPLKPLFKLPNERFMFLQGCEEMVRTLTSAAVMFNGGPQDYNLYVDCIRRLDELVDRGYVRSPYLLNVVFPVIQSYFLYKCGADHYQILRHVQAHAVDWYVAADEWINRRLVKKGQVKTDE